MVSDQQFEIPHSMRELAERNVEQARQAYDQLMDVARQAQVVVSKSQEAMTGGAVEIQNGDPVLGRERSHGVVVRLVLV